MFCIDEPNNNDNDNDGDCDGDGDAIEIWGTVAQWTEKRS